MTKKIETEYERVTRKARALAAVTKPIRKSYEPWFGYHRRS